MLHGVVAAAAWLAAQPAIRTVTRVDFDDARLLGRLVTPNGRWRLVGTVMHLANGALFAAVFDRVVARPSVAKGVLAAQLENAVLWPGFLVLDRIHPDRRDGNWPPLTTTPGIIGHEVLGHLDYGAVLGALARGRTRS